MTVVRMNTFLVRRWLVLLLSIFAFQPSFSQTDVSIKLTDAFPKECQYLWWPDPRLRDQVVETEQVLDLVQAWMADSIVEVRRQRLLGVGGWMAQRLGGRYWQYLDSTKRKYIGTMSRKFKIYDGIADEYDINVFLMPHLPAYIEMARAALDVALERGRSKRPFRFDTPAYDCPEALRFEDRGYLTIECEGTPMADYRDALAQVFLPMDEGYHELDKHSNFGARYPAMGTYGTWCMDCNHNCRPEIHPMEWMWWLDLSSDRPGSPSAKSWMIGVMRDGSRRLEDWSPGPMAGVLSVPVALPAGAKHLDIELEHLVRDEFEVSALGNLNLPEVAQLAQEGNQQWRLMRPSGGVLSVTIRIKGQSVSDGMRIWLADFEEMEKSGKIMGYVHLATSVKNIYAGRLTVDYQK